MKEKFAYLNAWGDTESIKALRNMKSIPVQVADCENILKDCSSRFERSLNQSVIQKWATDIVNAGFNPIQLEEVCKGIPLRFEKMPSLAEILSLLRPFSAIKEREESELDKLTRLAFPCLKSKFVKVLGEDAMPKLIEYFRKKYPKFNYPDKYAEMILLGAFMRCNFMPSAKVIIAEYQRSLEIDDDNAYDYYIKPLKRFCAANNLI